MGSRPFAIFAFAVVAAGLVFVGCGGGGGKPAATATPTPAATATRAPAAAATAAPTPEALALGEYVVVSLRIQSEITPSITDLLQALPSVLEDPEGLDAVVERMRGVSEVIADAVENLSEVTPPPEAEDYHARALGLWRDMGDIFEALTAALESGDPSRAETASLDLLEVVQDLGPVAEQGQRLAITALEADAEDPLNAYLISATEVQLELTAALGKFFEELLQVGSDVDAVFALSDGLIVTLEDFEDRWLDVSPPPEAKELHQRQADLIAEQIVVNRGLFAAIREGDEAAQLEAQQRQIEIGAESAKWGADWTELLIEALSR